MKQEVMAQLKKAYYAGYEECEKGDANCFTGWREWASQLQSPMRWETLARIEENKSVLSMAERHMDERACVVIKQRIFNLEQQLDESQEEGLCDAKPIGYEKLLMPESTQEEYAAQSNGIRWEYPQKPELANKALNRCYPEREGTFGSTFTDGYMQCMRDIEDGILPLPESTQEGGTGDGDEYSKELKAFNNQLHDLLQKKINENIELSKEVERLRGLVEEAHLNGFKLSGEGWNGEYPFNDCKVEIKTDETYNAYWEQFKADNNL